MTRAWALGLLWSLAAAPAAAQSAADLVAAANSITPSDIAARIGLIAADSMRGRATPSPELEQVARYIAGEFRRFGLAPAGDQGSFLQRYRVEQVELDTLDSRLELPGGTVWRFPGQVAPPLGGGRDTTLSGPSVWLTGLPDSSAAARVPIRGRFVWLPTPANLARFGSAVAGLWAQGPLAVVLVQPVPEARWQALQQRAMRPLLRTPWAGDRGLLLQVRQATAQALLASRGVGPEAWDTTARAPARAIELPDLTLRLRLTYRVRASESAPNVVGVLPGADPLLRQEYLVFSAHMDHVGVGVPDARGDSIYNGADDDASGTAAVLELAQAFAQLSTRPKRSLIFLAVSGEERGLWGSSYFTTHPPVPIGQMVANLNIDMVGRNWTDTIVVIGRQHSDLGQTLSRVAAQHPELRMAAIDDLWPEERFYFRSDHYNFARRGVPILFFFNGVHADYHRPSDEPAKINAEKESRIVKLIFYLGWELANAPERPRWNPDSYRQIVEPPR